MAIVTVDEERCKGCGVCLLACPKKVLVMAEDRINTHGYNPAVPEKLEECIACGFCARMCPDSAITVEK